jgi:hypothetical protein
MKSHNSSSTLSPLPRDSKSSELLTLVTLGLEKDSSLLSVPFPCSVFTMSSSSMSTSTSESCLMIPTWKEDSSNAVCVLLIDRSKRMMMIRGVDIKSKHVVMDFDINLIECKNPLLIAPSLLVLSFPSSLISISFHSTLDASSFIKSFIECQRGASSLSLETASLLISQPVSSTTSTPRLDRELGHGTTKLSSFPWSKLWGVRRTSTTSVSKTVNDDTPNRPETTDSSKDAIMPGMPSTSLEISSPICGSFRHVTHIGVSEDGGLDIRNLPIEWIQTFKTLGVTRRELARDPELGRSLLEVMQIQNIQEHSTLLSAPPPPPPPPLPLPPTSLPGRPVVIIKRRASMPETPVRALPETPVRALPETPVPVRSSLPVPVRSSHSALPPPIEQRSSTTTRSLPIPVSSQTTATLVERPQLSTSHGFLSSIQSFDKTSALKSSNTKSDIAASATAAGGGEESSKSSQSMSSHLKTRSEPAPTPPPLLHLMTAIQGFDKTTRLKTPSESSSSTLLDASKNASSNAILHTKAPNSNMLDKLRDVINSRRLVTASTTFKGDNNDDDDNDNNDEW